MQQIQIKDESLPKRCEVCHQSDCFDSPTNYCLRYKASGSLADAQASSSVANSKITINVTMLSEDYVHAIRYHNLHNKLLLIVLSVIYLPAVFIIFYVIMSSSEPQGEIDLLALLMAFLPALFPIVLMTCFILFGGYLSYKRVPDFQKNIRYSFSDSGYEISYSKGFSQVDWDNLVKVVETNQCFLFYPQKSMFHIIPKRGFNGIDEITFVRNIISSKLGSKAKLMTT